MTLFEIVALLLGLSALFGYLNHRHLHLPHTIGLVVIALAASGVLVLFDLLLPRFGAAKLITETLVAIDFSDTLLDAMLSFLLFAGAVHVDFEQLLNRRWTIGIMATVGVTISTFAVGLGFWALNNIAGTEIPLIWALVFGALITPTDPVAVLGLLKTVKVPPQLEAKIAGESLFNDGVGVVVFTVLLTLAASVGGEPVGAIEIAELFAIEVAGGAVLGICGGYVAFRAMRQIDEHNIEVLITLALVCVTYAAAIRLHMSGPIAVVVAGLFIGNHGVKFAMSGKTREHLFQFWSLTDEILNSVLFLLIGLEVLVIGDALFDFPMVMLAIPIALAARWLAVAIPIRLLALRERFEDGTITILTWGGLRGGISVALALSLPAVSEKPVILAATYAVVVFSIIVQGLTMKRVVARYDFQGADHEATA